METQWPEEKKTSIFYRGLRDELKDSLAEIVDLLSDCSKFNDLVMRLNKKVTERRGERPCGEHKLLLVQSECKETNLKSHDISEFMQIGGLRGPFTAEEKQRRRKLNLCLYCGKEGRFTKENTAKLKGFRKLVVTTTNLMHYRKTKIPG